jgi:hypothetical protein
MRIKISQDGTVTAIDHKSIDALKLGPAEKPRISDVEWDTTTQEWVAIRKSNGQVVARGKDRDKVVAEEHRIFESDL